MEKEILESFKARNPYRNDTVRFLLCRMLHDLKQFSYIPLQYFNIVFLGCFSFQLFVVSPFLITNIYFRYAAVFWQVKIGRYRCCIAHVITMTIYWPSILKLTSISSYLYQQNGGRNTYAFYGYENKKQEVPLAIMYRCTQSIIVRLIYHATFVLRYAWRVKLLINERVVLMCFIIKKG